MPTTKSIRSMLTGGDRRSIGRADEVVALVQADSERFGDLLTCLWDDDCRVAMRAADATEKLSRDQPALLQPHEAALLGLLDEATQIEVRWHLAVIAPRLTLTPSECVRVAATLRRYLEDRSSIVKTFALQGLADLLPQAPSLGPEVLDLLRAAERAGTPAMRARSRLLLKYLSSSISPVNATTAR